MKTPNKFLLEGIDRLGKDTLARGIQDARGYHLILHYTKPLRLRCYAGSTESPERIYQEASFRMMFNVLRGSGDTRVICNRAHLGEYVYAPMYRGYSGEYVFVLERALGAHELENLRLILLTEDFDHSRHFSDDGLSLGAPDARRQEQALFLDAFGRSILKDKRLVCVTDPKTGGFRDRDAILGEVLA